VITSNASCGGIGSPYMRIQWPIRIKLHRECGWTSYFTTQGNPQSTSQSSMPLV
jgi:hypothetical protein